MEDNNDKTTTDTSAEAIEPAETDGEKLEVPAPTESEPITEVNSDAEAEAEAETDMVDSEVPKPEPTKPEPTSHPNINGVDHPSSAESSAPDSSETEMPKPSSSVTDEVSESDLDEISMSSNSTSLPKEKASKPGNKTAEEEAPVAESHSVKKKGGMVTVVIVAAVIAIALVGVGYFATISTIDEGAANEADSNQQATDETKSTEAAIKPVDDAVVDQEVEAVDTILEDIEAIEALESFELSDETLGF